MSRKRKNRRKQKRKLGTPAQRPARKASTEPDEYWEHGPFRLARFGRLTVMQNLMDEAEYVEMLKRGAEDYPKVCQEISAVIAKVIASVREMDSVDLLRRGYWDFAASMIDAGPEESGHGKKQIIARDMIGYVQKLVCAVGSKEDRPPITQEQYAQLRDHISELHGLFFMRYFMARTAFLKQRDDYDAERDEFAVQAEGHWMHVQGDRYAYHAPIHLRELLTEHEGALQASFGVSLDDLDRGIRAIQRSLTFGIDNAMKTMMSVQDQLPSPEDVETTFDLGQFLEEYGVSDKNSPLSAAIESIHGYRLFDVATVTGWSENFCQALAVEVGSDAEMVRHAERGAWPTQPSQCDVYPFVLRDGVAYVFNQAHCMDVMYRAIERALLAVEPKFKNGWNARQKRTSERLALRMFLGVLPGAEVWPSAHYSIVDDESGQTQWAECDGLVLFDNHLIVVEVKAGAFSSKSPAIHPLAHINALKALVRDPINQGRRFVDELKLRGTIDVCDEKKNVIHTLSSTMDSITVVCVTLDQLTDLSPQIEHLRMVGVDPGKIPAWPVSIDDLRVITEILLSPITFMHFVEQRLRAFSCESVRMDDELDHLGAYIEHNMYPQYAEGLNASEPMGWFGYRDKIDRYYHERFIQSEAARTPRQDMPELLRMIVSKLDEERKPGFISAGRLLLNGDSESRDQLCEGIQLQASQVQPRPVSTQGRWPITVFANAAGRYMVELGEARVHACAVLQLGNDKERLLLVLDFGTANEIRSVEFELLTPHTAKAIGEEILRPVRFQLFESRQKRKRN